MKKALTLIVIVLAVNLISPCMATAQAQFTNTYNVIYDINENGLTTVTKEITIKNNTAEYYAQDFILSIPETNIKDLKATRNNRTLQTILNTKNNQSELTIKFDTQVVGRGRSITFTVTYLAPDIMRTQGKSVNITIPGVSDKFSDTYNIKVRVPKTKVSQNPRLFPQPESITPGAEIMEYAYTTKQIKNNNIVMSFGDTQNYEMNLIYYIHNPNTQRVRTEIALPPSTEYQTTTYTNFDPEPESIRLDADGNYIAYYVLEPQQAIEVQVTGYASVYSSPIRKFAPLTAEEIKNYTSPQEYWDQNDQIQELAKTYSNPAAIYDYVINTLSYDRDRSNRPQSQRLGAQNILANPTQAVCTEYTDLFIAIARAAGIPAREVNGYAFTADKDVRPLSLSQDTLHAWPEYYDINQQHWIPVDPTWGDTTGGYDYFRQFDTNHVAFVRKGLSSVYPYPAGAYKQYASDTNVFVQVLKENIPIREELQVRTPSKDILSHQNTQLQVSLLNKGNTSYISELTYSINGGNSVSEFVHIPPLGEHRKTLVQPLPWYQQKTFQVKVSTPQSAIGEVNIKAYPIYLYPASVLGMAYFLIVALSVLGFIYFARKK
jgi:transglutaminase-like putative cysteine protease